MKTHNLLVVLFLLLPFALSTPIHSFAAEQAATEDATLEGVTPDQADSVIAKMSDEQVRTLLVAELSKDIPTSGNKEKESGGMVKRATRLLHMLDENETRSENSKGFLSAIARIPFDYVEIARKVGNGSFGRFMITLVMFSVIFALAWLSEFIIRRYTANFTKQFKEKAIPDLDGPMRFIAGIMRSIPNFIQIFAFSASALVLFFLLPASALPTARYLFLAVLFIVVFYRILAQLSLIFCAPQSPALRVLPFDDETANALHKGILFFCNVTFASIMFLALGMELELNHSSLVLTSMALASFLIFMIIITILRSRGYVRERILKQSDLYKTRNWVVEQFAQFWHVPTILYFGIVWLVMVDDLLAGIQRENSAFLMSLLILPLFVFFNWVGQWVVQVSINTLQIYNPDANDPEDEEVMLKQRDAKERERKLFVTSRRLMSLAILVTLLIWVLNLWGVHIPYATNITTAVFESLIAFALGLIVWRFASSYIEKKIAESTPEVNEEEEANDDEWGGAAARGRSHTLLPMLRKFIASTLLVMVVLVILSALGVDIGPLLAGAGVVGLAIGFGAQKLVSDVFSGFFYLLDDAFRVGEYIKAGTVMGAVESITLRNVMLRHHRGMLQIVPHSELGSITNFMRGGIIEKFNLEFPYDADVDKIRKVIKKVGQAMLKDEEFEGDFIQPVKSAGVREITGSVMVIRVKFKTQPGAQFVIRREAYRRITEALAAKGIHYAHRKVIVELPDQEKKELTAEEQKALEAGAAAAILQQQEEEKKLAQEQSKK